MAEFTVAKRNSRAVRWLLICVLSWTCVAACDRDADSRKGKAVNELKFEQIVEIQAPVEAVWRAITDAEIVSQYYLCPLIKLDLEPGGEIIYGFPDQVLISGTVLSVERHETLAHSFLFDPQTHENVVDNPPSRVTYELRPDGDSTILTLTHDGFGADNQSMANVTEGWPIILNGLKTHLEGR